ncbi:hypothetical protein ACN47E_005559 [Coniothyrium glycines]
MTSMEHSSRLPDIDRTEQPIFVLDEPIQEPADNGQMNHPSLLSLDRGIKLQVKLRGFSVQKTMHAPSKQTSSVPQLLSPSQEHSAVVHLGTESHWHGLTPAQTSEISIHINIFRQCLVRQIEEHFHSLVLGVMNRVSLSVSDSHQEDMLSSLVDQLQRLPECVIPIDLPRLIRSMLDKLYKEYSLVVNPERFAWSLGSRDLPKLMYKIVRTQDCLWTTSSGPTLVVRDIKWTSSTPTLAVTGRIDSQPPNFKFTSFSCNCQQYEKFLIKPRYEEVPPWCCTFGSIHERVQYSIPKSTDLIRWNTDMRCMEITVRGSRCELPSSGKLTECIMVAHIATDISAGVSFERALRYAVNLKKLLFDESKKNSSCTAHTPNPKQLVLANDAPSFSLEKTSAQSLETEGDAAQLPWGDATYDIVCASPKKRLAFSTQLSSPLSLDYPRSSSAHDYYVPQSSAKRPRLLDRADSIIGPQLCSFDKSASSALIDASSPEYLDLRRGTPSPPCNGSADDVPSLESTSVETQRTLSTPSPDTLQHQIQRNYREFERQYKGKSLDVEEGQFLERFLLESSDQGDWAEEVSALSEESDGVEINMLE